MRMVMYIAILVCLAGASVWIYNHEVEEDRKEVAIQYMKMVEAEEQAQSKAKAAEEKEKEDKFKAVKMLNTYLDREKLRLNKIVEEAKIAMEKIDLDQKDLSDAIAAVEKKNAEMAEKSRKRNIKRFDKAERVSLILKDPTINSLAGKYLLEDLTATYAKYKAHVNAELKVQDDVSKGRRANRDEYYKSIKGLNEKVEEANVRARKQNEAAIREAEFNLKMLQKQRKPLEREQTILMKQVYSMTSPNHEKRLHEVQEQIAILDEKIAPVQALLTTIKAQAAHMDATETKSMVRKKQNIAQDIRTEKDDDVINQARHEGRIYDIAASYESNTLDRIRDAMKTIYMVHSSKAADARKTLDYISRSVVNIDLLKADEIEKIRKNIVEELSKGLTEDREEKERKR